MTPTAAILIIGNEILSGQTQDVNVAYLSQELADVGIDVMEVRMVLDDKEAIIAAVHDLKKYTYVFTTGGIGPTHDDITANAMACAFNVPLESNPEALKRMNDRYPTSKSPQALVSMSYIPRGAHLIDNPHSAAPGFQIGNVYVMAGVPVIMQSMFKTLVPRLEKGSIKHDIKFVVSVAEGVIAADLKVIQEENPTIDIGSYPRIVSQGHNLLIVAKGRDKQALKQVEEKLIQMFAHHQIDVSYG